MKKATIFSLIFISSFIISAYGPDYHRSYPSGNGITYKAVSAETSWPGVEHRTSAFIKDAVTGHTYRSTYKTGKHHTRTSEISQVWNWFGMRATSNWTSI